jgi:hypothetical protein
MSSDVGETVADLPRVQIRTTADTSASRWVLLALTAVGMILFAAWSSSGESNAAPARVPGQLSDAPVER